MDYDKERHIEPQTNGEVTSWDVAPERDNRSLGNKIISTPEATPETPDFNQLGQILPAEPELGVPDTSTLPPTPVETADFNYQSIREEKGSDRISPHALAEIGKLEDKLSRDGNIASFYESARDLTGAYLENSFDRKLGEQK